MGYTQALATYLPASNDAGDVLRSTRLSSVTITGSSHGHRELVDTHRHSRHFLEHPLDLFFAEGYVDVLLPISTSLGPHKFVIFELCEMGA